MSNFKVKQYRNKKIRDLAKGQDCQHCGKNDGSTVAAHMNGLGSGRGMGLKAHDYLVAYLCADCHSDYDLKNGLRIQSPDDFTKAILKTQAIWIPRLIP